jgi:serine/threonine-protein kinase
VALAHADHSFEAPAVSVPHAAAGVREGDILAGKYRVDRVLGQGGMGVVVAAHHVELDDRVAIKFLLPEALHNGEAVARFAREAQAAVKIKSEHVARVTDVGRLDNGAPYIVMEYLEGLDLSAWLQQRGRLPVDQAVEFLLQACEAIAEAHALGIVHRDLKPANLFVIRRPDGGLSVKVLDFGIAKRIGAAQGVNITSTAAVMGSPLYMSPEQLNSSKDADARTDVWALGVILYELLAGEAPFLAETVPGVMLKITASEPPSLRALRPEVPVALERVILRCLEKDRSKRLPTIGDLAHALVDFGTPRSRTSVERISGIMAAAGISLSMTEATPAPPSAVSGNSAGTMAAWNQGTLSSKRGRGPLIAVLAGGALALLGVTWFALRHDAGTGSGAKASAVAPEATTGVVTSPQVSAATQRPSPAPTAPTAPAASAETMRTVPSAISSPAAPPTSLPKATAPAPSSARNARTSPAAMSGKSQKSSAKISGKAAPAGKLDVYDDRK